MVEPDRRVFTGRAAVMRWHRAALLVTCLLLAQAAVQAADFTTGALKVSKPWARATAPAATTGAVYLTLTNSGTAADRLLSLDSPVARQVQIHETRTVDGMMEMRELDGLDCPPRVAVRIEPGALHIMLLGLKQPLKGGTEFPLALHFRDAGVLTIRVAVRASE